MSWFCKHKWIESERFPITRSYVTGEEYERLLILYKCEKCGKVKKVHLP